MVSNAASGQPTDGESAGVRKQQALGVTGQLNVPDGEEITVILAIRNPNTAAWVHEALKDHPSVSVVGEAHDGIEAAQMARELAPSACILEAELPVVDGYETAELVSMVAPEVATVLVHDEEWVGGSQAAMRLGVRACVAAGQDPLPLLEVMTKIAVLAKRRKSSQFLRLTDPAMAPNVIVVSSAKGGVGKTTIATNVAVTLAKRYPDETLLVDYYSHYGDAALMLGLRAEPNICDLARDGSEVRLPSYLQRHESGLRVLAGASAPAGDDPLASVEFAGRLLTALRTQFRVIVFDVPPFLTPAAIHLISRCNHFVAVANFHELTALRDTMVLLDSVRGHAISEQRIRLVANRVNSSNRHLASDLEQLAAQGVCAQLPDDHQLLMDAVNAGEPFVMTDPRSALSRAIVSLVDQLDQVPTEVEPPSLEAAPEPARPLLRRWLGPATGIAR